MTDPLDIVPWSEENAEDAALALISAFGQADEARLIAELEADGDLLTALVATIEEVAVGAIAFSRVWIDGAGKEPAVALGPVGVTPPLQRMGVGARLVLEGLAQMEDAGETVILVLGDPVYYERFGFDAARAAGVRCPWNGPAFQALTFDGSTPAGEATYPGAFLRLGGA